MNDMNITNAQFTATGSITALVDGAHTSIPADAGNRHYSAMIEQGITPVKYVEPAPTAASVRAERNALLAATDYMGLSDYPVEAGGIEYRQALRDVPQQAGFPKTHTWPNKP